MKLDNREGLLMQRQRSQSLMEFSLSLIALAMLISGLMDLGRLFFIYTAMEDIVGEGALYLSIDPNCNTKTSTAGENSCADPNNALFRMSKSGSGVLGFDTYYNSLGANPQTTLIVQTIPATMTANEFRIRVCYPSNYDQNQLFNITTPTTYCPLPAAAGPGHTILVQDVVYVEMHYGFKLLTPFMPAIAGINPLRLSVAATSYTLVD